MGLDQFKAVLAPYQKVAFDAAPIIYYVEGHTNFKPIVDAAFYKIDKELITGYTSIISLTEILVHPCEHNLEELKTYYQNLLLFTKNFYALPVDEEIALKAAQLRGKYRSKNVRTPDALQIATAMSSGCDVIITNDKRWREIEEIPIIIISDFI